MSTDSTREDTDDSRYVTLAEFAAEKGLDESHVKKWRKAPTLPRPVPGVRHRPRGPGQPSGRGAKQYRRDELSRWYDAQDTDDSRYVTLAEFAAEKGRGEQAAAKWRQSPTFPDAVPGVRRRRPGQMHGPGAKVYDRDKLSDWYDTDGPAGPPAPLAIPSGTDPHERMALGAIARLLDVDARTVTQCRTIIEQHVKPETTGTRKRYPIGEVVKILNNRPGMGTGRKKASEDPPDQ